MLVHLNLLPLLRALRHADTSVAAFILSILGWNFASSIRKPKLYNSPPALPSFLSPFLPHPLTTLPLCSPKLRGVLTTTALSKMMPYHLPVLRAALDFLNPFTPIPATVFLQNHVMTEAVELEDGDRISVVWPPCSPPFMPGEDTLVLILPGMNNSSETGFVRSLQQTLTLRLNDGNHSGHVHVCILDYRLTGTSLHLETSAAPHPACADNWRDFSAVLNHINYHYDFPPIHLVGESLGGGMTLRYLGSENVVPNIVSATCVSPPVDYGSVARHLEDGLISRVCNFIMTVPCKITLLMNKTVRQAIPSLSKAMLAMTVRQFEDAVLVPLLDYTSPQDYYDQNSPEPTLTKIRIPTMIVTATDDPIVPPPTLPPGHPALSMATVDFGGHLGFFGLSGWSWADTVVAEHVRYRHTRFVEDREKKSKLLVSPSSPGRVGRGRSASSDSSDSVGSTGSGRVKRRPSLRGVALGF